jgi:lysophospholipase L1-like esterase
VDDLREVVLKKNDATTRFGLDWRTNSQGMRDREYSQDKPPGTFRVALVGDSIGAGWGVNAEDRFEEILEELWNKRAGAISGRKVEFINCAVPGHSPGQRWYHFGLVGWPMKPDLVIYEATAADIGWDERRLRFLLARGIGWDCPIYHEALTAAGVQPLGSPDQYKRALQPRHWEILAGVYRYMAADCRARGVPVFWILVPRIGRRGDAEGKPALLDTARKAGFAGLIDLTDAFDDLEATRLTVDRDDFHPNALGHARIAQRLDQALEPMPQVAKIWARATDSENGERVARGKEPRTERVDKQVTATSFTPESGGRPQ